MLVSSIITGRKNRRKNRILDNDEAVIYLTAFLFAFISIKSEVYKNSIKSY